jgi:hypothetical protein
MARKVAPSDCGQQPGALRAVRDPRRPDERRSGARLLPADRAAEFAQATRCPARSQPALSAPGRTTTRWLSEAEVADLYRDRFRLATDQSERVRVVLEEGLSAMDTSQGALLAVGLVPTSSGSMAIDLARLQAVVRWASDFGPVHWWRGFFHQTPSARAGARRIRVTTVFSADRPTNRPYAELHTDGSGFAAVRLFDPRRRPGEGTGTWVLDEDLLLAMARTLRLLGRHARDHTGAWGDALVEAHVIGTELQLACLDQWGMSAEAIEGARTLEGPLSSRHTLPVDAIAGRDQNVLASARLVATDLFHAFGSPEARQIAADGTLRIRHIHGDHAELRRFAAERGVEITEEVLGG